MESVQKIDLGDNYELYLYKKTKPNTTNNQNLLFNKFCIFFIIMCLLNFILSLPKLMTF
jgi:hypothetical protein